MKVQSVVVTPEMAKAWLKTNTLNREVRPGYVKGIAQAMKRGEWVLNHQPIALNGSKLLDGQHRLMAFLASGLPKIQMMVAYDVPTDTFDTIDIGAKRSHADIFREDRRVMNPVSAVGRLLFGGKQTPHQLAPIYEKLKGQVREIVNTIPRGTPAFGNASIVIGILAAILSGEDKAKCLKMYKKMASFELDGLPRIAQLFVRQVSLTKKGAGKVVKSTDRNQLIVRTYTTFKAENADMQKLLVKKVEFRLDEIRQIYKDALGIK